MPEPATRFDRVAGTVCGKPFGETDAACFKDRATTASYCGHYHRCRIAEMTNEQLDYVLHPLGQRSYLKACPGSGKTEAVALKAAYALRAEAWKDTGIAFLSFTNHAANVIKERVARNGGSGYPHFLGTFDSWLHGYVLNPFGWRVMGYAGTRGDHSVRIVDAASNAAFLNGFRTKYAYAKRNVHAHHFFVEGDRILFASDDEATDAVRNGLTLADWQLTDLLDAKARFWRAGFAIHDDVETLCGLILRDLPGVRDRIANRFPHLVIDECQDLCPSQLGLLSELRAGGVNVHLVGDLNQSIFSFRGSDPAALLKHIVDEKLTQLVFTVNFRSVQAVVDVCGKIVAQGSIQGLQVAPSKPHCVYIPYTGKAALPHLASNFAKWLAEHRELDPARCAVIARGSATLQRLRGVHEEAPRTPTERIAVALHNWKKGDLASRREALKQLGSAVTAIYFSDCRADTAADSRPDGVASAIEWRLFLARALDACVVDSALMDFTQTWTAWTTVARTQVPHHVATAWTAKPNLAPPATKLRAPHGKGDTALSVMLAHGQPAATKLHFTNIHQVKGETFDGVLVVSSPTKAGDGGHWHQWLDTDPDHAEHNRFAYVASSRPRYLLAWAVPNPTPADETRLAALGFTKA